MPPAPLPALHRRARAGVRNISNCLSIRTRFDRHAKGLHEHAVRQGLWAGGGDGPLDWAAAFSRGGAPPRGQLTPGRESAGAALLRGAAGRLDPGGMMAILRDARSGICMSGAGGFRSNGAQVSWLREGGSGLSSGGDGGAAEAAAPAAPASVHWFTGTPDPRRSAFKPFVFGQGGSGAASPHTAAPPARCNPRHALWRAWQAVHEAGGAANEEVRAAVRGGLQRLEARGLEPDGSMTFEAAAEEELRLYESVLAT